jgi:tetratricopeptide (TPR) repeat protein
VERTFIGATGADYALTLLQRFLLAGRVIWFYAGKLVWPVNLAFSYPRWNIDPAIWWQYLYPAGVLAVAVVVGMMARRNRGPLAAFLIFVGTLFPVVGFLNVFPFRFSWVADHFQYLASLGIIVALASWLTSAAKRFLPGTVSRVATLAALAAVLGIASSRQSRMYTDAETLYRETLTRNPDSFLAHNNLGSILLQMPGRAQEAMGEFEAALRIEPDFPEGHFNLASALEKTDPPGARADIIREYETACRIKPDYAEAHNSLGNVLAQVPGRLPDAMSEFQTALRISPSYAEAHNNLANAFSRIPGRLPDAISEYQTVLRLRPEFAQTHANLGKALMQTPGRADEGIAELQLAVRLRPDLAELHYNLGTALSRLPGRLLDGIAELEAAVRIRADLAEAHFNLATDLSQIPERRPEAIAEFEATLRIRPDFEPARQSIARLHAIGR